MELELKKEQFACYQALPQLSENREETTETIVPDSVKIKKITIKAQPY